MPDLCIVLKLSRCPHCGIAWPLMRGDEAQKQRTSDHAGGNCRTWRTYMCSTCGGLVLATAQDEGEAVTEMYPAPRAVSEEIPERARDFLAQAINSIAIPAGAVMLAASAVDAMLKDKGYTDRNESLFKRIEKAVDNNLITPDMGKWAHKVRLDANDERHTDLDAEMATEADASKIVRFAEALGEFLYVLPAQVTAGLAESPDEPGEAPTA